VSSNIPSATRLTCSCVSGVVVRRAVWGITAMKRMSTLAALASASSPAGEFQADLAKYKEESEKEDVHEVRYVAVWTIALSEQLLNTNLTGSRGNTSS